MKKLLWVGDAGCPSGFAKATHAILDTLRHHYDVTVLGINYRGDPHAYPYPLYAAAPGGDMFGIGRLVWMCDFVKPDVIVIQNDGWNIPFYMQQLGEFPELLQIPVVAIVAVDGKNFRGEWLKGIAHAIFWTQFALDEARAGGYHGPASVIPLGVDRTIFYPRDKMEMRRKLLPAKLHDAFIVGNVNRNQPRKRWDLLVRYFALWLHKAKVANAYLFLHTAPTGDTGIQILQLATFYGVAERIATVTPDVWYGPSDEHMAETYNCFDVNASTTQGEGFGLTTLESMACNVPQIVPDWSALGDWAKGAAWLVPCTTTAIGPPYVNVIGGVADEQAFIQALGRMYSDIPARQNNAKAAFQRSQQERFSWSVIGDAYLRSLECTFGQHTWGVAIGGPAEICAVCGLRRPASEGFSDQSEARPKANDTSSGPVPAEKENRSYGSENSRASSVE